MSKDDSTWLRVSYLIIAAIGAMIFLAATETLGNQTGWAEGYKTLWEFPRYAAAVIFGSFISWLFWRKKDRHEYFLASIGELRKVKWPSFEATRAMTIIVVIVCVIFGFILYLFDLASGYGVGGIEKAFTWFLDKLI